MVLLFLLFLRFALVIMMAFNVARDPVDTGDLQYALEN
jgi:hypothetical protein